MKIILADNHDSFVYNICGLLEGAQPSCRWQVATPVDLVEAPIDYDALIISPGPGLPQEMPGLISLVGRVIDRIPVLGICLGMQAIALWFGAALKQLEEPRHGHRSPLFITDANDAIIAPLNTIPSPVHVGRYHSWVVDEDSVPPELVVSSHDEEGNIMSLYHRSLPVFGLQFHPESIITDCGQAILNAFLNITAVNHRTIK